MRDVAPSAEADLVHMRRALALAQLGWGQTAPNPMVGAVVVAGGDVVGEGYHARYGEAHAEVVALQNAGDRAHDSTMYVNLEPCAHHGKTPPCVDAVIAAGVARVVIAVRDPSEVARGGMDKLRAAGIDVTLGTERDAALELNAPFFNAHASARPWVTLKLALSRDGRIADPTGLRRWITGPESRAEVHRLRANADAIAVGVGTVLADDPSLTVRDAPQPRVTPQRVVFDSSLRTPPDSALLRSAREVPTTLVVPRLDVLADRAHAIRRAGAAVLESASLDTALRALRDDGVRALFVEGGARLAGSFLAESLVDRLIIFRSPIVLGDDAPAAFAFAPPGFETSLAESRIVEERRFGDDLMTIYALEDVPCSPD
jgi:diaminohydroxyphosphoribosylaminopyrimidine deaminase / 5-amino-6-(5-phosphoribosylamino)uracil reductase